MVTALPAVILFIEGTGGGIHWLCGRTVVPLLRRFPFVDRLDKVNDRALLGPSPLACVGEIVRVRTVLAGWRHDTCAVL